MNRKQFNIQDELDLLAAGELDDKERQCLFAKLDAQPESWKQCAFALLENQALDRSLNAIQNNSLEFRQVLDGSDRGKHDPKQAASTPAARWRKRTVFATAACLLVAVGMLLQAGIHVALDFNVADKDTAADTKLANSNVNAEQSNSNSIQNDPELTRQVSLAMNLTGVEDYQLLAFVGVEELHQTRLYPIIRSEELQQQMSRMPKAGLAADIADQMQRSGWQLQTHQQFVSIDVPGKSKITMPVGMLNCRYVGRETF